MNVNWEEDFVVLHELLRSYHVLRRFRDEQSYIVWLGRAAATAKREKKIARIFNLCDVLTLRPISLRVILDSRRAIRDPVSLFAAIMARTSLLHRPSFALSILHHKRLTSRSSVAALLLALHVLV